MGALAAVVGKMIQLQGVVATPDGSRILRVSTTGENAHTLGENLAQQALAEGARELLPQGIVPKPMKVVEFKAFVDAERTKFGKIVEQANIKLSN